MIKEKEIHQLLAVDLKYLQTKLQVNLIDESSELSLTNISNGKKYITLLIENNSYGAVVEVGGLTEKQLIELSLELEGLLRTADAEIIEMIAIEEFLEYKSCSYESGGNYGSFMFSNVWCR